MYKSTSSSNCHSGLEDLPIDYELAKDLTALRTLDSHLDYHIKLRKMEILNPSLSNLEEEGYKAGYKIGIDFMTNQPNYMINQPDHSSRKKTKMEIVKEFEALQDFDASIRVIERFPDESFF